MAAKEKLVWEKTAPNSDNDYYGLRDLRECYSIATHSNIHIPPDRREGDLCITAMTTLRFSDYCQLEGLVKKEERFHTQVNYYDKKGERTKALQEIKKRCQADFDKMLAREAAQLAAQERG